MTVLNCQNKSGSLIDIIFFVFVSDFLQSIIAMFLFDCKVIVWLNIYIIYSIIELDTSTAYLCRMA